MKPPILLNIITCVIIPFAYILLCITTLVVWLMNDKTLKDTFEEGKRELFKDDT